MALSLPEPDTAGRDAIVPPSGTRVDTQVVQDVMYLRQLLCDTKAATVQSSVDAESDCLSLRHRWWVGAGLAVVSDVPDGVGSNKRMKAFVLDALSDDPKVLYDEASFCTPHRMHNAVVRESREDKLVGHLHAVVTSWSIAARRERLIAAFTEIVNDGLQVFPGPPPEEYKVCTKRFVNQTLLRRVSLVRSRSHDSDTKRGVSLERSVLFVWPW